MRFKDFVTLQRGFDLPKTEMCDGPYPVIGSTSIIGYHNEHKVTPPGVVMGRSGSLGTIQFLKEPFWPHNTSLWVKDFKGNDPRFVYYRLQGFDFARFNAGAGVPSLNRNHLDSLEVEVPELPIQRRIAAILSSYDDLIANNLRRIKILEEMARALYREWFVEFRFHGHTKVPLVVSAIGQIPKGWEVKPLPESVHVNPHVPVPRDSENPFVPMGCLANDSMLIANIEVRAGNSGSKFQNGDTLFARITPCLENGKTGFVQFLPDSAAVACGSTEFIVLRSSTLTPEFVYLLARSEAFRANAIKSMSGASGRQRVQERCFDSFMVAQPTRNLLGRFSALVAPSFTLIQTLHLENDSLRRTQDLLLPRLLSGKRNIFKQMDYPIRTSTST